MLLGYIVHWLPQSFKDKVENAYYQSPLWGKVLVMVAVTIVCYQTYSAGSRTFIYFQF